MWWGNINKDDNKTMHMDLRAGIWMLLTQLANATQSVCLIDQQQEQSTLLFDCVCSKAWGRAGESIHLEKRWDGWTTEWPPQNRGRPNWSLSLTQTEKTEPTHHHHRNCHPVINPPRSSSRVGGCGQISLGEHLICSPKWHTDKWSITPTWE